MGYKDEAGTATSDAKGSQFDPQLGAAATPAQGSVFEGGDLHTRGPQGPAGPQGFQGIGISSITGSIIPDGEANAGDTLVTVNLSNPSGGPLPSGGTFTFIVDKGEDGDTTGGDTYTLRIVNGVLELVDSDDNVDGSYTLPTVTDDRTGASEAGPFAFDGVVLGDGGGIAFSIHNSHGQHGDFEINLQERIGNGTVVTTVLDANNNVVTSSSANPITAGAVSAMGRELVSKNSVVDTYVEGTTANDTILETGAVLEAINEHSGPGEHITVTGTGDNIVGVGVTDDGNLSSVVRGTIDTGSDISASGTGDNIIGATANDDGNLETVTLGSDSAARTAIDAQRKIDSFEAVHANQQQVEDGIVQIGLFRDNEGAAGSVGIQQLEIKGKGGIKINVLNDDDAQAAHGEFFQNMEIDASDIVDDISTNATGIAENDVDIEALTQHNHEQDARIAALENQDFSTTISSFTEDATLSGFFTSGTVTNKGTSGSNLYEAWTITREGHELIGYLQFTDTERDSFRNEFSLTQGSSNNIYIPANPDAPHTIGIKAFPAADFNDLSSNTQVILAQISSMRFNGARGSETSFEVRWELINYSDAIDTGLDTVDSGIVYGAAGDQRFAFLAPVIYTTPVWEFREATVSRTEVITTGTDNALRTLPDTVATDSTWTAYITKLGFGDADIPSGAAFPDKAAGTPGDLFVLTDPTGHEDYDADEADLLYIGLYTLVRNSDGTNEWIHLTEYKTTNVDLAYPSAANPVSTNFYGNKGVEDVAQDLIDTTARVYTEMNTALDLKSDTATAVIDTDVTVANNLVTHITVGSTSTPLSVTYDNITGNKPPTTASVTRVGLNTSYVQVASYEPLSAGTHDGDFFFGTPPGVTLDTEETYRLNIVIGTSYTGEVVFEGSSVDANSVSWSFPLSDTSVRYTPALPDNLGVHNSGISVVLEETQDGVVNYEGLDGDIVLAGEGVFQSGRTITFANPTTVEIRTGLATTTVVSPVFVDNQDADGIHWEINDDGHITANLNHLPGARWSEDQSYRTGDEVTSEGTVYISLTNQSGGNTGPTDGGDDNNVFHGVGEVPSADVPSMYRWRIAKSGIIVGTFDPDAAEGTVAETDLITAESLHFNEDQFTLTTDLTNGNENISITGYTPTVWTAKQDTISLTNASVIRAILNVDDDSDNTALNETVKSVTVTSAASSFNTETGVLNVSNVSGGTTFRIHQGWRGHFDAAQTTNGAFIVGTTAFAHSTGEVNEREITYDADGVFPISLALPGNEEIEQGDVLKIDMGNGILTVRVSAGSTPGGHLTSALCEVIFWQPDVAGGVAADVAGVDRPVAKLYDITSTESGGSFTAPYVNGVTQDAATGAITTAGGNGYTAQTLKSVSDSLRWNLLLTNGFLLPRAATLDTDTREAYADPTGIYGYASAHYYFDSTDDSWYNEQNAGVPLVSFE